tara:strand:- start:331 stop:780 length:450 start_codon:yes stop_codon:yes gene_type:complete
MEIKSIKSLLNTDNNTLLLHYYTSIFHLLSQLTECPNLTIDVFLHIVNNLSSNHHIYILCENESLLGMATLLIEQKLIHNAKSVGHIEDVVIDENHIGKGYGKILIEHLCDISKENNCYKVILDCNDTVKKFYENCGFTKKTNGMALYF